MAQWGRCVRTEEPDEPVSADERLAALHRAAGALTHDFANLLSVILNTSETLAAELNDDTHRALALAGLKAAEYGSELLKRLMDLAGERDGADDMVDCTEALLALKPLARHGVPADVALAVNAPSRPLPCAADPTELEVALLNLALNAGQATPAGGRVAIRGRRARLGVRGAHRLGLEPGDYAALSVTDTGCGMDAGTLARATEPLFTTRADGTGLGLASVSDFARRAHGALALRSKAGRGTTATLYLPLSEAPATSVAA